LYLLSSYNPSTVPVIQSGRKFSNNPLHSITITAKKKKEACAGESTYKNKSTRISSTKS
jgi:hypothetical protein